MRRTSLVLLSAALLTLVTPVALARPALPDTSDRTTPTRAAVVDGVLGQPSLDATTLGSRCEDPDARFNRADLGGFVADGPTGIAISPGGRLFVADMGGQRILSWPSTHALRACQPADQVIGSGQLVGPEALALTPDGDLVVADTLDHAVKIFGREGGGWQLSATLGTPGEIGGGPHQLHFPRGVAVAPNGRLFVADDYNNRIAIFDPPFEDQEDYADYITAAADGFFSGAKAVALDGHSLYVADYYNSRVLRFDGPFTTPDQVYVAAASYTGIGLPVDLAVGPGHDLFVAHQADTEDYLPSTIARYDDARTSGNRAAPDDDNSYETTQPLGMAFDGAGRMFVADYTSYRVVLGPVRVTPPTVRLAVDAKSARRKISPLIYGINFAPPDLAEELGLPTNRWGGDTTDTYNWKLRSANEGINYYFTNYSDCWIPRFDYCTTGHSYSAVEELIEQDREIGTTTVLNLPMVGYVAKDQSRGGPGSCSFPVDVYPVQDEVEPSHGVCGNGRAGGEWIPDPDPTRAGLAIDDSWIEEWVDHLVERYGTAADGGVDLYELGNEPGIWHDTHRDFHADPVTYDELWTRARSYAEAVHRADPTARTLGPSEVAYSHLFCSAADVPWYTCVGKPDRLAHGDKDLVAWYLEQFRDLEQQTGVRYLDYLDVHHYPGGNIDEQPYDPPTDVTRSLWDEDYEDPWWGDPEVSIHDPRIELIPRMKQWVKESYRGTKTAITEYNMALGVTFDKQLQNVLQADTLGIFGRQGLDLATFWAGRTEAPGTLDTYIPAGAFRIYLNYNGSGGRFGNVKVAASSTDQGTLAMYAAQRGATGVLTLVVVNKATEPVRGPLTLARFPHRRSAEVYRTTGDDEVRRTGSVNVGANGFTLTYPARSVTLVAVRPR